MTPVPRCTSSPLLHTSWAQPINSSFLYDSHIIYDILNHTSWGRLDPSRPTALRQVSGLALLTICYSCQIYQSCLEGLEKRTEFPLRREHLCHNWWFQEVNLISNQQVLHQPSQTQTPDLNVQSNNMQLIKLLQWCEPTWVMQSINRMSVSPVSSIVTLPQTTRPLSLQCHLGCHTNLNSFGVNSREWLWRLLIHQNDLVAGEHANLSMLFSAGGPPNPRSCR